MDADGNQKLQLVRKNEVKSEIYILKNTNHKNINRLLGFGSKKVTPKKGHDYQLLYLILDYINGQLLFEAVSKFSPLGERYGYFFFIQLMKAVNYLHSDLIRVAHCDIKLDNMMVDKNLNLFLYDFGFAMFGKLNALTAARGTK